MTSCSVDKQLFVVPVLKTKQLETKPALRYIINTTIKQSYNSRKANRLHYDIACGPIIMLSNSPYSKIPNDIYTS